MWILWAFPLLMCAVAFYLCWLARRVLREAKDTLNEARVNYDYSIYLLRYAEDLRHRAESLLETIPAGSDPSTEDDREK